MTKQSEIREAFEAIFAEDLQKDDPHLKYILARDGDGYVHKGVNREWNLSKLIIKWAIAQQIEKDADMAINVGQFTLARCIRNQNKRGV